MNRTIATGLATLTLALGAWSSQAEAQGTAGHSGVRDRAHMFSADAVKKADTALEALRGQTRWQVVIETVDSLDGKTAQQAALENAKELKVHGLYVLIAKKEHKVELEPSDSARKVFSVESRRGIVDAFTTAFKAKEFDKGLLDAVALIRKDAGATAEVKPAPTPPSAPQVKKAVLPPITLKPTPPPPTLPKPPAVPAVPAAQIEAGNGGSIMTLVIVGVVVLFLVWVVSRIFRRPVAMQQPPSNAMMGAGYGPRPAPGQPVGNPPQPGYAPQPGYGPPPPGYGYGPPPPQHGGGGFMSGMLGGLGGAIAGNILYDQFGRPHQGPAHTEGNVVPPHTGSGAAAWPPDAAAQPNETYDPNAATGGEWSDANANANEPAADTGATGGDWGGGTDDSGNAGGDWGGAEDAGGTGGDWGGGDDSGSTGGDWGGGGGDAGADTTQGGDW